MTLNSSALDNNISVTKGGMPIPTKAMRVNWHSNSPWSA
jgi:hypothetical protein